MQIRTNWYREPRQVSGNGVYAFYVEGCIKGLYYRVYYWNGMVVLEGGESKERRYIKKRMVIEPEHFNVIEVDPEIFLSYANQLIEDYAKDI